MTAVTLVALAIATVVVMLARGRPRDDARAGFVSPEEGSPPPSVAVPGTFAEDVWPVTGVDRWRRWTVKLEGNPCAGSDPQPRTA